MRHLVAVLPLYFPRTEEEAEHALLHLPSNTGGSVELGPLTLSNGASGAQATWTGN